MWTTSVSQLVGVHAILSYHMVFFCPQCMYSSTAAVQNARRLYDRPNQALTGVFVQCLVFNLAGLIDSPLRDPCEVCNNKKQQECRSYYHPSTAAERAFMNRCRITSTTAQAGCTRAVQRGRWLRCHADTSPLSWLYRIAPWLARSRDLVVQWEVPFTYNHQGRVGEFESRLFHAC